MNVLVIQKNILLKLNNIYIGDINKKKVQQIECSMLLGY